MSRVAPTAAQLAHCIAMLTRFIPTPPKPTPQPQDSRWGAKVGQRFNNTAGQPYEVVGVDSVGVTLRGVSFEGTERIEDKHDWDTQFTKVKAPGRTRRSTQRRRSAVDADRQPELLRGDD